MLNKNKEISTYFIKKNDFILLLVLSNVRGWGVLKIKSINLLPPSSYTKSHLTILANFYFGFYKNIFQYFKINGMGLKAIMHIRGLIFKLGYSHRVFYLYPNNIRIHYENKKYFKLESRSILNLKNAIWSITTLKKMNAYKKKGVYLRGGVYGVKISIKKAKV